MKLQVFNPYLPEWEYVPDGEPHVFGDRVYVYGSHDRFGAAMFCVDDYVCWSAPVDDLSDWRLEGTIFRKNQDPVNRLGLRLLFAPDVARGADGHYYLFYAFDFMGTIGVAVCDEPAGAYEYLGHVSWSDGTRYGRRSRVTVSLLIPVCWWTMMVASGCTQAFAPTCRVWSRVCAQQRTRVVTCWNLSRTC